MTPTASPPPDSPRRRAEHLERAMADLARDCARLGRWPVAPGDVPALNAALDALARHSDELGLVLHRHMTDAAALPADKQYFMGVIQRRRRIAALLPLFRAMPQPPRRPLYPEAPPPGDMAAEQLRLSDTVFMALHRVVNPAAQAPQAEDHGCFTDIPLPPSQFLAHAHAARRVAMAQGRPEPLRFLDVGCGGGVKVLLAAEIFAEADGLEYDPGYADAARGLMARLEARHSAIITGDALRFDGYADYDVIYFYQPMQDLQGLMRLERRIVDLARPGTLLIAPYDGFRDRCAMMGAGHVAGRVYVNGAEPDEALALRDLAEETGTHLPHPQTPDSSSDSYLNPMIRAARAAGHVLT